MGKINLLPLNELIKTSEIDHADWNYRPFLGWIQRLRFKSIVSILKNDRFQRLLEVGYGSGVFLPALKQYCVELYGIDPHDKAEEVRRSLINNGVTAELFSGSITRMPFDDSFFECIIAVSTLEYIDEIESACEEIIRVLSPNGLVVLVTPGYSPIVDLGLQILTGESASENYADRRQRLLTTLLDYFSVKEKRIVPRINRIAVPLYLCMKLQVKHEAR